jgi:PAS domain S-box-containing protein
MNSTINIEATKKLLHDSTFYYMICTDVVGNYSYINNHYAKAFSYIHPNFVGQPYYITMHPDDTKICEEVGGKCFEFPGQLFPATIRKHNGDGGYIVTQWEYTLMVENGEPQGVFCIGFDITEFESAKKQVTNVNKALSVKNEILEAIAFEQSHIVRAPLANIIGLVSILKNLDLGANADAVVKMLEESSNKLDGVIQNIVKRI